MKYRSLYILLLLIFNLAIISVNAETNVADWNELVNVRYSLYLDAEHTEPVQGNIDNQIDHIYLSLSGSVPPNLLEYYPDASNSYLSAWIRNIVGMSVGETNNFVVPAEEGYPEGHSSGLGGKPLYFSIYLLQIVFEVADTSDTNPTSENPSNRDFFDSETMGAIFIFLALFGIVTYSGISINRNKRQKKITNITQDEIKKTNIKKRKKRIQELKNATDVFENKINQDDAKKEVYIKKRR